MRTKELEQLAAMTPEIPDVMPSAITEHLSNAHLEAHYGSAVTLQALRTDRLQVTHAPMSYLSPIQGFTTVAPQDRIQFMPYGAGKQMPPQRGYSGVIADIMVKTNPATGGGYKDEETHCVLDPEWAPGSIYNQIDVVRAKENGDYSELSGRNGKGLEWAFAIFMEDGDKPHPMRKIDPKYASMHNLTLTRVISSADICWFDAYWESSKTIDAQKDIEARTQKLLSQDLGIPNRLMLGKGETAEQARTMDAVIGGFGILYKVYEANIAAFNAVKKRGEDKKITFESLCAKAYEHIPEEAGASMQVLIEAVGPRLDMLTPAMLAARDMGDITSIEKNNPHLPVQVREQLEIRRAKIRLGFLESIALAQKAQQLSRIDGYHEVEDDENSASINPLRWNINGFSAYSRRWAQMQQVINDGAYKNAAQFVAKQYGEAFSDTTQLIVQPTMGTKNRLTIGHSMDDDGADGILLYAKGQGMPYAAPHGAFPSEIRDSIFDNDATYGLLMPGMIAWWGVHGGPDLKNPPRTYAVDLLEAPGKLYRQCKELGALSGYGMGLTHKPTLTQMLNQQPDIREYAIARANTRTGKLDVHSVLYERMAALIVRSPSQSRVEMHPASVVSRLQRRQNEQALNGASRKSLFGKKNIAILEPKVSLHKASDVSVDIIPLPKQSKQQTRDEHTRLSRQFQIETDPLPNPRLQPFLGAVAVLGGTVHLQGPAIADKNGAVMIVMRSEGRLQKSGEIILDKVTS